MMRYLMVVLGALALCSCSSPIEDIQSPDSVARAEAALRFGKDASPAEIKRLIGLLEAAADHGVRASCADALGYARATEAVPALIEALQVREWRVRRSTTRALGRIADPRAVDPLLQILNEAIQDPNLTEGRRCAIYAFVNLKSDKAVPVLIRMLSQRPGINESDKIDHTTAILAALGAQKDNRAIPVLARLLDGRAGSQAAAAIGQIVDVDFRDHGRFGMPIHSPAKAKEWLQEHPELVTPKDR